MSSRDLLKTVASEFASEDDAKLDQFLELAAQRMSATEWGGLYTQGAVYLAAHLLTLQARAASGSTGAGPVVGVKTGDREVRYGASVGVLSRDSTYATTSYGLEYLNLRRSLPPVARVV